MANFIPCTTKYITNSIIIKPQPSNELDFFIKPFICLHCGNPVNQREKANENRFKGIVLTEIVRFSNARKIGVIKITVLETILALSLTKACDTYHNTIQLDTVIEVIRDVLMSM